MKVKVISKEAIKPSSPTPTHLRSYRLSCLDVLAPKAFMPIILFFSEDHNRGVEVAQLKISLSETLTHFYPLAGRIISNYLVECNDMGVNFYEAQVDGQLAEILQQSDGEKLKPLLPSDYYRTAGGSIKNVLFAVQVNVFDCGRMAIGMCFSHTICDGASFVTFINAWASMARGSGEFVHPSFDSTTLFPPTDDVPTLPLTTDFVTKEKIVTKSFVFGESKIDILRGKHSMGASVGHPTRVESVSALIWRCAMRARPEVGACRLPVAIHAVNVRRRMVPPLPEYSFGNLFGFAVALGVTESKCRDDDVQRCFEGRLREAIRMFDSDYIKKMRGLFENMRGEIADAFSKGDVDLYSFTSWCSFPLYDVDFGLGKPIWVSSGWMPVKNSFVLMGRRWGDGIEVWANMAEEDMAIFEEDEELLAFVKLSDSLN